MDKKNRPAPTPLDNLLAAMTGRPLPEPPVTKPDPAPAPDPTQDGMPPPVIRVGRDAMGRPWAFLVDTKGNPCQK